MKEVQIQNQNCSNICVQQDGQNNTQQLNDFVELFPFVVNALEHISEWNDTTSTDTKMLHKAMDLEFIIYLQLIKVNMMFPFL